MDDRKYGEMNDRFDERARLLVSMGFKYERIEAYDIAIFVKRVIGMRKPITIQTAAVCHATDEAWEDILKRAN